MRDSAAIKYKFNRCQRQYCRCKEPIISWFHNIRVAEMKTSPYLLIAILYISVCKRTSLLFESRTCICSICIHIYTYIYVAQTKLINKYIYIYIYIQSYPLNSQFSLPLTFIWSSYFFFRTWKFAFPLLYLHLKFNFNAPEQLLFHFEELALQQSIRVCNFCLMECVANIRPKANRDLIPYTTWYTRHEVYMGVTGFEKGYTCHLLYHEEFGIELSELT